MCSSYIPFSLNLCTLYGGRVSCLYFSSPFPFFLDIVFIYYTVTSLNTMYFKHFLGLLLNLFPKRRNCIDKLPTSFVLKDLVFLVIFWRGIQPCYDIPSCLQPHIIKLHKYNFREVRSKQMNSSSLLYYNRYIFIVINGIQLTQPFQ